MFRTKWFKIGVAITILAIVASLLILQYSRNRADSQATNAATKKTEDEIPKLPAYVLPPVPLPGRFPEADLTVEDFNPNKTIDYNQDNWIKPGHWFNVMTTIVSTERDAQARFVTRMTRATGETVPVLGTDRWLNAIRSISLPKGQWKQIETTTYVTPREMDVTSGTFQFDLLFGNSTYPVDSFRQPTSLLEPGQYMITILDQQPGRFEFVNRLDCVQGFNSVFWPRLNLPPTFNEIYRSASSRPNDPPPWPRSALTATTVAHVIWSDFDPAKLDAQQQTAMIDWLHWGGSLVVSGPLALERLAGSFLEPYLPAKIEQRAMLRPDELTRFFEPWSPIAPKLIELPGCYLQSQGDGRFYGDSKLFCDRAIGRGRIVVVGFPLEADPLLRWPCYSNFFNGAILGKPGRDVSYKEDIDNGFSGGSLLNVPRQVIKNELGESRLHFLNRDGGITDEFDSERSDGRFNGLSLLVDGPSSLGNAAWNDHAPIPRAAAEILREKSSFKPPSSEFVLKVLAAYLVLLIPLNWLVFRFMGRLEWAWVAAPAISILGAIAVTKLAALDVGFTRGLDTIAVLELQGGYQRGHLAEYSALYSSLSTNFRFEFEQNDAQLLPMATESSNAAPDGRVIQPNRAILPLNCSRGLHTTIDDFLIRSNTTGHIHAERMVGIDGPISLTEDAEAGALRIDNQSELDLEKSMIVRKTAKGFDVARIDRLPSKSLSGELQFQPLNVDNQDRSWNAIRLMQPDERQIGGVDLSNVLAAALATEELAAGEYRLLAQSENDLSPMVCEPAPTHVNKTLVVSVRLRSQPPSIDNDNPFLWKFFDPIVAESQLVPEDFIE